VKQYFPASTNGSTISGCEGSWTSIVDRAKRFERIQEAEEPCAHGVESAEAEAGTRDRYNGLMGSRIGHPVSNWREEYRIGWSSETIFNIGASI
jgi:hypothetical protein